MRIFILLVSCIFFPLRVLSQDVLKVDDYDKDGIKDSVLFHFYKYENAIKTFHGVIYNISSIGRGTIDYYADESDLEGAIGFIPFPKELNDKSLSVLKSLIIEEITQKKKLAKKVEALSWYIDVVTTKQETNDSIFGNQAKFSFNPFDTLELKYKRQYVEVFASENPKLFLTHELDTNIYNSLLIRFDSYLDNIKDTIVINDSVSLIVAEWSVVMKRNNDFFWLFIALEGATANSEKLRWDKVSNVLVKDNIVIVYQSTGNRIYSINIINGSISQLNRFPINYNDIYFENDFLVFSLNKEVVKKIPFSQLKGKN